MREIEKDKTTMKPATIWCCILLLIASIGNLADAAISDEGKQAIERMRLKQQSAEAEPAKPGLQELADHLRKKHEQNSSTETSAEAVAVSVDEPATLGTSVKKDLAETNEQIAEDPPGSETITFDACSDSKIMAEKYDHMPDTLANKSNESVSPHAPGKSRDMTLSEMLVTVMISCFFLVIGFSAFGASIRNHSETASCGGCVLMLIGIAVAITVLRTFWPLALLLLFGAIFGQKGGSSSNGSCGCGCGFILLILLFSLL